MRFVSVLCIMLLLIANFWHSVSLSINCNSKNGVCKDQQKYGCKEMRRNILLFSFLDSIHDQC